MPSYLDKQQSAFAGSLASAASKISNPTVAAPAKASAASSLAPPSPSPSAASDTNTTPKAKSKYVQVYSQPEATGTGTEVRTNMAYAVEKLKDKSTTMTAEELEGFLSLGRFSEQHKEDLMAGLRKHPRVEWKADPKVSEQTWRTGTYTYLPIIPGVKDKQSLLAHLQKKRDASGLSVRDLKDGWPKCDQALEELERIHKILVFRTKKDNLPRAIWLDDPSLHHHVNPEFVTMWHRTPIPSIDDMHRKLVSVGQKPTSEDPRLAAAASAKPKVQKKRAGKRVGKTTNVHMAHLMKDYNTGRLG